MALVGQATPSGTAATHITKLTLWQTTHGTGNTYWNGWNIAAALLQYADWQVVSLLVRFWFVCSSMYLVLVTCFMVEANDPEGDHLIANKCNQAVVAYIKEVSRVYFRTYYGPSSSTRQSRV